MTSHVAVSTQDFVIVFSDSQGTVGMESEVHGGQKLFFGPDFLVAKAGSDLITHPLFKRLAEQAQNCTVNSSNVHDAIRQYLADEIRPHHWGEVQFLTATPCPQGRCIQTFMPEVFANFASRSHFASIGSGATFVYRMLDRLSSLQCPVFKSTVPATYCIAKRLADAANESLTVDDTHLVGMIADGKSYALGDRQIQPDYLDQAVCDHWLSASQKYDEITALAETANSQIDNAFRSIHGIWLGTVETADAVQSVIGAGEVMDSYNLLNTKLNEYFAWYDGLLGR